MNLTILKNIEKFGVAYYDTHLKGWDKERLSENWWYALGFFFSHSFMRGRRDKLSNEYYCFTVEALKNYFKIEENQNELIYSKLLNNKKYLGSKIIRQFKKDNNSGRKNSIKHPDFSRDVMDKNPLIKALISKIKINVTWTDNYQKELSLGNDADIMMVLDTLLFISKNENKKNIYLHIKTLLEQEKVNEAYNELTNIRAVGDKIATFFIRDIMLLNSEIKLQNYKLAFPVDTWIFTIADKLNIESKKLEKIKEIFIEKAIENNICPLKLAAGLWYLGSNSLDILIEKYLEKEILI